MYNTIQQLFRVGMDRFIPVLASMPEGLVLNVGAGNKKIPNTLLLDWPEWDADRTPIPMADNSVDGIHAYHFLEHCADPIGMLLEFQRVLRDGGVLNIIVPFYNSSMAAQDLDHKARFCENTWKTLFENPYYKKHDVKWELRVNVNLIIGVAERNLCLMTQMIKNR